jgi:glycosyltransferase involved in cell wall biosynthesis
MAKISAVLPTYNGEKFIRQAIESCLAQSWQDFELVVVNDASTDSTPEIVRSYLDQRIILVQNTKNETLPGALNTGFRLFHLDGRRRSLGDRCVRNTGELPG